MASLPKTLDDTYERILCNIDKEYAQDALKVLQWLAFSKKPLKLREVAEATAISLDDTPRFDPEDRLRHPTDVLAICSSLVHVDHSLDCGSNVASSIPNSGPTSDAYSIHNLTENSSSDSEQYEPSTAPTEDSILNGEIRLAHFSVKEYLVSERIKRNQAAFYSMPEAPTHAVLARSCLTYLLHFEQPLSDPMIAEYMNQYPLLRYCIEEWDLHVIYAQPMVLGRPDYALKEAFLCEASSFSNFFRVRELLEHPPPDGSEVNNTLSSHMLKLNPSGSEQEIAFMLTLHRLLAVPSGVVQS